MARAIDVEKAIEIIEEKQKELCPLGRYGRNYVYGSDREKYDAWEEIIDALDNLPTLIPPNEPLTIQQLREMDGEPVWVEFEDDSGGLWGIVHITIFEQIVFANGLHCTIGERYYGKSYKAYRRPPEGEA